MDTLSHILVGGLVGNAVLGRRIGNKAVLWGAAVALLPDIDVPLGNLMSDMDELIFHRNITHSLPFIALMAPLLGYLLSRLHRHDGVSWQPWAWLCGLVLLSHLSIDLFTSYGIQLLQPFSNTAYSIASISVIDPLYTLPLLLAFPAVLLLRRERRLRLWLGYGALSLSTAYLGLTVVNKLQMQHAFERQLYVQGIDARRTFVKPTFFNNILWRGIAETDDAYWVGFRSLFDSEPDIRFQRFAKNHDLLSGLYEQEAVRRLVRVSDGYYKAERRGEHLLVHDMRYGKGFEWMSTERDFVFSYRLVGLDESGPLSIETIESRIDPERERASLAELLARIRGV